MTCAPERCPHDDCPDCCRECEIERLEASECRISAENAKLRTEISDLKQVNAFLKERHIAMKARLKGREVRE